MANCRAPWQYGLNPAAPLHLKLHKASYCQTNFIPLILKVARFFSCRHLLLSIAWSSLLWHIVVTCAQAEQKRLLVYVIYTRPASPEPLRASTPLSVLPAIYAQPVNSSAMPHGGQQVMLLSPDGAISLLISSTNGNLFCILSMTPQRAHACRVTARQPALPNRCLLQSCSESVMAHIDMLSVDAVDGVLDMRLFRTPDDAIVCRCLVALRQAVCPGAYAELVATHMRLGAEIAYGSSHRMPSAWHTFCRALRLWMGFPSSYVAAPVRAWMEALRSVSHTRFGPRTPLHCLKPAEPDARHLGSCVQELAGTSHRTSLKECVLGALHGLHEGLKLDSLSWPSLRCLAALLSELSQHLCQPDHHAHRTHDRGYNRLTDRAAKPLDNALPPMKSPIKAAALDISQVTALT